MIDFLQLYQIKLVSKNHAFFDTQTLECHIRGVVQKKANRLTNIIHTKKNPNQSFLNSLTDCFHTKVNY